MGANDAVNLALQVLVMATETLHIEAKQMGPQVSWARTKIQMFGFILVKTSRSSRAVHYNDGAREVLLKRDCMAVSIVFMDSLSAVLWCCSNLCRTKILVFELFVLLSGARRLW